MKTIEIVKYWRGIREWEFISFQSINDRDWYLCEFAWEQDTEYHYVPFEYARVVSQKYVENVEKAKNILYKAREERNKWKREIEMKDFDENIFN